MLGAAHALREAIGTVVAPCERPQHDAATERARLALGEDAFEEAWRRGLAAADPATLLGEPNAAGSAEGSASPAAGSGVRLRVRALGAATVELGGVALTAADIEAALAAAGRARPAEAALPDLQNAIAAYGGDFLTGMNAGEWAQARRDELRRRFESALLAVGRLQAAAGRYQAAVTAFRRAIEHEPLNESAHRGLMTCWDRLGETARAVRHYEDFAALLREQVGVPPAGETTELYKRLVNPR